MDVKIALLAGDGIGPEIVAEATKVLDRVAEKFGHKIEYRPALVGAAAIDAVGDPYPDETHAVCLAADAVLFGAIGDPKYDNDPTAKVRPEQGLLRMRKSLGLFANLRPVALFDALADRSPLRAEVVRGTDFICVRELTGGIYFGRPQGRDELAALVPDVRAAEAHVPAHLLHGAHGGELPGSRGGGQVFDAGGHREGHLLPQGQQGHPRRHVGHGEQRAAVGGAPAVQAVRLQNQLHRGGAVVHGSDLHMIILAEGLRPGALG